MSMIFWTLTNLAAADCAPLEIPLEDATTLGVRELPGDITIVGVEDGTAVRATSEECGLRVSREGNRLLLSGPKKVGAVHLEVPASLAAVGVFGHRGAVKVSDVPGRVAVVSGEGPVEIVRVGQLRVDEITGDVRIEAVSGELTVGHVTGDVVTSGSTVLLAP